jgi:hypothetical protein
MAIGSREATTGELWLDGPLLRAQQAARLPMVRTSWVSEAVRSCSLPCLRVERYTRFRRGMPEVWLHEAGSRWR